MKHLESNAPVVEVAISRKNRRPKLLAASPWPIMVSLALALAWLTISPQAAVGQSTFYVSPSGDDLNDGLTTNTAVKTLSRAQMLVRGVNANMTGDVTVFLRDGTHPLLRSLTLTQADSGFNGYRVIWRAYPNETPSISGGVRVTNWTQLSSSRIWSASVMTNTARNLYVNQQRRPRAASKGRYLDLESYIDGNGNRAGFYFPKGRIAPFVTPKQVELHTREDWRDQWVAVTNVVSADNWRDIWQVPASIFQNVAFPPYFDEGFQIENDLSLLDEPGEWVLDRAARKLYYWPQAGEDPNVDQVVLPVAERLIDIQGASASTRARNIRFDGITFENVNWSAPNGLGYVIDQASYYQQPGAGNNFMQGGIQIKNAANIDFLNNIIVRSGRAGLSIDVNCAFINLIGNTFMGISEAAIVVGNPVQLTPGNGVNTDLNIKNNLIYQIGREFRGACAIDIFAARRAVVDHNHIEQVPFDGISLGWFTYGTATTTMYSNILSNNRIEYYQMVCRDGGGIYTLGTQSNSWVTGNYLRKAFRDYGGIYHDDTSSYITTSNNVVEGPPSGNGQWMFAWNSGSERGLVCVSNWSTTGNYTFDVTGGAFQQAQIYANANWPAAAQAVTNNAGLEPAYKLLLKQIPHLANKAPVVYAGTNATVNLLNNLELNGSASDDGQPCGYLALKWSKVSGPGAVYFDVPSSPATFATFSKAGTYVLKLTADDSLLTASSNITVTVTSAVLSTNLALRKPAIAYGGSFGSGYEVANGNDGDVNTAWVAVFGAPSGYVVDLGAPYPIVKTELVTRQGGYELSNFRIKVSNSTNKSSFKVVGRQGTEGVANAGDTYVVNVAETNAYRYVMADATALGEFRVYSRTNASPPGPPPADLTTPGDPVAPFGGASPAAETVTNAFDNSTYKYLNFGANVNAPPFVGPVGLVVTPAKGVTLVTGIRFYTANDSPERDPADYTLEGSNDNGATYTVISSGELNLPDGRNAPALSLDATTQYYQEVSFSNTQTYKRYKITFNNVKNNSTANSMQIGEVELLGWSVPVANSQSLTNGKNVAISITLTGFGPDRPATNYIVVTNVQHGTLTGVGANRAYLPSTNYFGPDSFSFVVSDGYFTSTVATVSLTITNINRTPVTQPDTVIRYASQGVTVPASQLLTNDYDLDQDVLTMTGVANPLPAGATIRLNDNQVTYWPAFGDARPGSFTYTLTDGNGAYATGLVTVLVSLDPVGTDSLHIAAATGSAVSVSFNGIPGFTYTVQRALSLNPPDWQNLIITNADGSGVFTVLDADLDGTDRFYRTVRGVAP